MTKAKSWMSGPEATQQGSSAESAPETAPKSGHPSGDHHHGQAGVIPGCSQDPRPHRPPSTRRDAREQPGRELPLGYPPTRTKTAEVQIAGLSPEVPRQPLRRLQHVQSATSPDLPTNSPNPASPSRPGVGKPQLPPPDPGIGEGPFRPGRINVSVPARRSKAASAISSPTPRAVWSGCPPTARDAMA